MIGRFSGAAWFNVDFDRSARGSERRSGENMIDAPPFVCLQRTRGTVVPKRILLAIRVEFAEHIDEPPRDGLFIGVARVFVITDMLEMFLRTMDIYGPWRHIHVPTPDRRLIRRKVLGKILPKAFIPD